MVRGGFPVENEGKREGGMGVGRVAVGVGTGKGTGKSMRTLPFSKLPFSFSPSCPCLAVLYCCKFRRTTHESDRAWIHGIH